MSDSGPFGGGPDDEYATVRKLNADVLAAPDDLEKWQKLIVACENFDGGLNRNSRAQTLDIYRDVLDRFLTKFPLLFGYWKQYADKEFNYAGPEAAEYVYERGCASIINSVDLWTAYCTFKMSTTHKPYLVREIFERGAAAVGTDFLAHPFWDKYIEFEENGEDPGNVLGLLKRIVAIPLHQYARYFEKFRTLCHTVLLADLVEPTVLAQLQAEVANESQALGGAPRQELEIERDIRGKIDNMFYAVFTTTQAEVNRRWTFESEIKRPYFHVTELDHTELNNWRKYLDFEESEGNYARIVCLYERCLVTCALYDDFWLRYARWMASQPGKEEEVGNIYNRASTTFVPISRPGIRLQWAYYEEGCDRIDIAEDIHGAILEHIPDCMEVIVSLANLKRRQRGIDEALQVYQETIASDTFDDVFVKGGLVGEWAFMVWKVQGLVEKAREIFTQYMEKYADSRMFWDRFFQFELEQPLTNGIRGLGMDVAFEHLRSKSRLSAAIKREFAQQYMKHLVQHGDKDSMKLFLKIDRDIFGPRSVARINDSGVRADGQIQELDTTSRLKAERKVLNFFDLHAFVYETQGTSDFN